MSKQRIKKLIEASVSEDGLMDTGVPGVRFFRATAAIPCAPAVYEPCIIAIVSGSKEAMLDGQRYVYGSRRYLCCPTSLPIKAGCPAASAEDPLLGAYISLDQRVMTELVIELENLENSIRTARGDTDPQSIKFAEWDDAFSDALFRLISLVDSQADSAVLGEGRLRELYYSILKGEAGIFARQAFGVGNGIARSISYLSSNLNASISIDEMAKRAGMSRAVFHRKFKQATTMSPVQFVKSMRLNSAAMKIVAGTSISEAAMEVGYVSPSQFSREFKRLYGHSPRQWSDDQLTTTGFA